MTEWTIDTPNSVPVPVPQNGLKMLRAPDISKFSKYNAEGTKGFLTFTWL